MIHAGAGSHTSHTSSQSSIQTHSGSSLAPPNIIQARLTGEADVIICFTRLRLKEVRLRGITTKIELDRLNAELVVEDII